MWLTRKRRKEARQTLVGLLERTRILIDSSEESCYAGLTPAEISAELTTAIDALNNGEKIDRDHLRMHFAPTGTLQETAMMSGWTDEYMTIAEQFDGIIASIK
ncbi:MAG: hypothetical protein ABJQ29_08925 [Luteolibacter sp.]